ncbi:MAG: menaquinol-cytochrome C reductase [Chloroflexi bacterium]|nr:menaquinol-cytochrome C reductase [Chloroflexota bacterium]
MAREIKQEFFPKDPKKTYGLMEVMKGRAPLVGKGGPENSVFAWPNLLIMEVLAALGVTLVVVLMGMFIRAPLREFADADKVQLVEKAPWYFLNLQELLRHMNPSLAGVILPTIVLGLLAAIPYVDRSTKDVGIWFSSKKGKIVAAFSAVYALALTVVLIAFNELYKPLGSEGPSGFRGIFSHKVIVDGKESIERIISDAKIFDIVVGWTIPVVIIFVLSMLLVGILKQGFKANLREMLIGVFSAFVAVYAATTISGLFFRGENFGLVAPWNLPPNALSF